jgi:hypothetical protein
VSGRRQRDAARRWLWANSGHDRQRSCGRDPVGQLVGLTRRDGAATWAGLETCGSVWSCPVCSGRVLAERGDELRQALDAWHGQGGAVAMVTLTMRHGREHALADCWDALSDAWAAASGRYSGVRAAKLAADVAGWARRVEVTWGARHGWHVHVHALVFLRRPDEAGALGEAMFAAWAARLGRVGLTPLRDSGGLDVRVLSLDQARQEAAGYVAKGTYSESARAAAELTGGGKLGRGGNLTPWGILDAARRGDRQARALWAEWEATSHGRRAITWSEGLRDELDVDQERDDDEIAGDGAGEIVAWWARADWPALRDAPEHAEQLLSIAEGIDRLDQAHDAIVRYCDAAQLPRPRPPT